MQSQDIERAQQALRAYLTPRFLRLDRLERYVRGTQYDGRPSFWNDARPLYERAPCVVYPVAALGIRSTIDLCLGEGRWPAITACEEEAEEAAAPAAAKKAPPLPPGKAKKKRSAFDPRFALSEDEADTLDKFVDGIVHQARLRQVADELLDSAMGVGSAIAIGCVRAGRLCVEVTSAKWCTAERDGNGDISSLEIRYPYLEEYRDERENKWKVRARLFRRVIDTLGDVTFLPAEAHDDGREPEWRVDTTKSGPHGLGFCPVHWYRYKRRTSTVAEVDGQAIHAEQLDEIDALNFGLSQRHAAAMIAASPPTVEIGVDLEHNPAPMGETPRVVMPDYRLDATTGRPYDEGYSGHGVWTDGVMTGGMPARKRGPAVIWRYPSADSRVEMLTIPGDALKPIDDDSRDLLAKIEQAMSVVTIDPNSAKFSHELSGKAIARLYDRQIRLCDKVREDFGDHCLLRVVDMLLRIALAVGTARPGALYLPGLADALPILSKFQASVEGDVGATRWFSPEFDLTWGAYFEPTEADDMALVKTVLTAHSGGYITKRTAVEKLAEVFPSIGNVDEYLDALEEEAADKAAKAVEQAAAMAAAAPPTAAAPGKPPPRGAPTAAGAAE